MIVEIIIMQLSLFSLLYESSSLFLYVLFLCLLKSCTIYHDKASCAMPSHAKAALMLAAGRWSWQVSAMGSALLSACVNTCTGNMCKHAAATNTCRYIGQRPGYQWKYWCPMCQQLIEKCSPSQGDLFAARPFSAKEFRRPAKLPRLAIRWEGLAETLLKDKLSATLLLPCKHARRTLQLPQVVPAVPN